MDNPQPIERARHTIFHQIHNGMHVFDQNGDRLGHVAHVFFGADADTTQEHSAGAASAPDPSIGSSTLDHVVDAIFGNDDLPETLQNRLINDGFIQIEGDGLFAEDRYVLREQIASVSGDEVHLNVTRDELIER
jgi:uncharacterized protein YrrD